MIVLSQPKCETSHGVMRKGEGACLRGCTGQFKAGRNQTGIGRLISGMRHLLIDESGSAVLEFIMIALPLFIPLSLYLNSVNSAAQGSMDLQNIARQVARAYITSPSEGLAIVRANEVLAVYQNQILPSHGSRELLTISIQCEAEPCLTPNGKVSVRVSATPSGRSGSATQVVDSWRSSG